MKIKKNILFLLSIIAFISMLYVNVYAADNIVTINNVDDLSNAIQNQQDGQVWQINAGTYNLTQDDLNKYKDVQPGNSNQGNWYFPIHKNNITIEGINGTVIITSDVQSTNGAWATQDFVTVWGDNVTIKDIDFKCKKDVNKAIEIMGKDFTLKNCNIVKLDNFSGSIAFNSNDIGNATIDNVTLDSWITASYSNSGTLTTSNITIDFTNNECAGLDGFLPVIKAPKNGTVKNTNFNLYVDSKTNLIGQVFTDNLPEGTTIHLTEDATVDKMLDIKTSNVTLDLGGHKLTASDNFTSTWENKNDAHLLQVLNASNVTIKNGSLVTTDKNKHGVNVFDSNNVTLENLKVDHTNAITGAPIVINNSSVTVNGNLDLTIGENSWYGINVDPKDGNASLNFAQGSSVSMNGKDQDLVVKLDGEKEHISISGAKEVGLELDEKGDFVIKDQPLEKDDTPNTGLNNNLVIIISILALCSLSIITLKKIQD